jgi:hypothetical protein
MEWQHPLLASAGGGLDQSASTRKWHQSSQVVDCRLIGDRDVSIPGSDRIGACCSQESQNNKYRKAQGKIVNVHYFYTQKANTSYSNGFGANIIAKPANN